MNDAIHFSVSILHSPGYDRKDDTIYLDSTGVDDDTIVHEATHALIDATHPGLDLQVGLGEAAAYLAEAMFAMNDDRFGSIPSPKLMRASHQVAKNILDYYATNPGQTYQVSPQEILSMQLFMDAGKQDLDKVYTMDGLKAYRQKYG